MVKASLLIGECYEFQFLKCWLKSTSVNIYERNKLFLYSGLKISFYSYQFIPFESKLNINLFLRYYLYMRSSNKVTIILVLATLICVLLAKSDYKVVSTVRNTSSVLLTLSYTGTEDYYMKQTSPIVKTLEFHFQTYTFFDFSFKITDPKNKRFEVPQSGIFPIDPEANFTFPIAAAAVTFQYNEFPFDFRIIRKQNGAVIFSTYNRQIIYSDHYLEIGTEVDSEFVYGIGERFQDSFRRKDGKWTIFNRDRGQQLDKGTGRQTYGFYPFYLLRERNNLFHINYFRSSNALDYLIETEGNKQFITIKVIGGILDFRFFLGEQNPEATVQRFNLYSGRAAIPPFWGFGFHQCRYGYKDITYLQNVIAGYEKNGIPLDTIWTDIDYMIDYEDFTIDQKKFPLDRMNKILENYHYIPIIDAGIKNSGSTYDEGIKRGVFIKEANTDKPYVGKVWPGATTFVDFFHPNGTQFWSDMLAKLYQKIKFSGIWLDMNQLANFCQGACQPPQGQYTFDYSKDLPYHPGDSNVESNTISLNATHYGNLTEANVHAFFGFMETYATNLFLKSKGLRPFIITRSTTLGSGKYGFHWTGDNRAQWQYLKGSIADNFNSQMFGIQMVGPDMCGFGGNTTPQLCARWFQLGSLYTFARDHNDDNSIPQQPFALGDVVLQAAKVNLKLRYSFLKYFYFLFVTKRGLGTIWKPLFFEYPLDSNSYIDDIVDTQVLIGQNILVTPIVEEGKTSRKIYLPQSNWYHFHTGIKYGPGTHLLENVALTDKVPLFIKQGFAMVAQDTTNVVNTKQLGNTFKILSGMFYDTRRSNATTKVYESVGGMLSIKDYNDDNLVDLCIRQGCQYDFQMIARISSTSRTLEIDFVYVGGRGLNQEVLINEIHLTLDPQIIVIKLEQAIRVNGPEKVTIPIPASSSTTNLNSEKIVQQ